VKPRDALLTSLRNLSAHKMRSSLAMLGVVFGVGAVIAMLSIGAGAEREALAMIQRLGVDNVLVRAREFESDEQLREVRETSMGLSQRDLDAIAAAVPGVAEIAPKVAIDAWEIRSASAAAEAEVLGVAPAQLRLSALSLHEGRFIDQIDILDHAQVCVLGRRVAHDLYGWEPALGDEVEVNEVWLTVVGVLEGSSNDVDSFQGVTLSSSDDAIYIPVSTALRKFDRSPLESPFTELVMRIEDPAQQDGASLAAAASTRRLLEQLHGAVQDYDLVVPQALLEQSRQTQRLFNFVMGSMASISLLVGGIGIMNIMLASVLERTREIGVRRAVGARRRDVQIQFVAESFTISLIGGVAGIVLGIGLARGIAVYAGWPTVVSVGALAASTLVAMMVGVVSGLYPAVQAARLDPIESLRYE
jgi:putative ABC transport system permease protein